MKKTVRVMPIEIMGEKKWAVVLETNNKEPYCLRCGKTKNDIRNEKISCSLYGKSYQKHVFK